MSEDCKYASNNKYFHCPPRMADGRHFTDYRPNCDLQNETAVRKMNSNEYRNWLSINASEIIKNNQNTAFMKNGCGPCKTPFSIGTMLPEQTKVVCEDNVCRWIVTDIDGLGQGRELSMEPNSTLDQQFSSIVKREDDPNCCGTPSEVFNYYGDLIKPKNSEYLDRTTAQDGGEAMHGGDPDSYEI